MQPTYLDELFSRFVRERKYLQNVRLSTIEWYELSWRSFRSSATPGLTTQADLTIDQLQHFIYTMRDRGVRPVTCNNRLRALNAFFRWMHERGDLPRPLHMRLLKVEKRLLQTMDNDAIKSIVGFRPPSWVTLNKKHREGPRKGEKAFALWRVHALVCGLLDTGCRVQERGTAHILSQDHVIQVSAA
jgi:site-specific recombinase XerD